MVITQFPDVSRSPTVSPTVVVALRRVVPASAGLGTARRRLPRGTRGAGAEMEVPWSQVGALGEALESQLDGDVLTCFCDI